jgi:hypothetical protein
MRWFGVLFAFLAEPQHEGSCEHGCEDCGKNGQPYHLRVPVLLSLQLLKVIMQGQAFTDIDGIPVVVIVQVNEVAIPVAKTFLQYVELTLCDAELAHHFSSVEMGVGRVILGCVGEECGEE